MTQQKRHLSIHEHHSMGLLSKFGVDIPRGKVARTPQEAEAVATELGTPDMVIKAQVLAGGRGKGEFESGLKGGVRTVFSPSEVRMFAEKMLGQRLITHQTGAEGRPCNEVFICERQYARREYYFAILMDRASAGPVLVGSSQGGVDIESVAAENPDAIVQQPVDIDQGLTQDSAEAFAAKMGFTDACVKQAGENLMKLYQMFIKLDCTLLEINPMAEDANGRVICMDAKLNFDDNAEGRQKEVFELRDFSQEDSREGTFSQIGWTREWRGWWLGERARVRAGGARM